MKINVVKDKSGKVIATYEDPGGNGPKVTPELDQSHSVHLVEVPEDYRQDIQAVYKQHSA
jgi:hypothetical protein